MTSIPIRGLDFSTLSTEIDRNPRAQNARITFTVKLIDHTFNLYFDRQNCHLLLENTLYCTQKNGSKFRINPDGIALPFIPLISISLNL